MPDVMVPPEEQMCVPNPARARMHRWFVFDGAKACGGGTVRGRGLFGDSAKARDEGHE